MEPLSYRTAQRETATVEMRRVGEKRENNELLKVCDTEKGRGSLVEGLGGGGRGGEGVPDKLLSLIPFVCVKGCDCVTFAGSNPAPSFSLIMQGPIRIQGDTCHQQRFSNKWGSRNSAKLAAASEPMSRQSENKPHDGRERLKG